MLNNMEGWIIIKKIVCLPNINAIHYFLICLIKCFVINITEMRHNNFMQVNQIFLLYFFGLWNNFVISNRKKIFINLYIKIIWMLLNSVYCVFFFAFRPNICNFFFDILIEYFRTNKYEISHSNFVQSNILHFTTL